MILSLLMSLNLFLAEPTVHPLHISVTEISFDQQDKALEIMMRVFMDDLETSLRSRYKKPELDVLNPGDKSLDQMMTEYLKEHFSISLDDKVQGHQYLGHEREGEAFIFYVEVSKVRKWKNIEIKNDIIMEMYDDQSNLVHVTSGETVKSLRLTKRAPSGTLSFEH